MAAGAPVRRLAMAVVVARRDGLHAAATRFAASARSTRRYARCATGCWRSRARCWPPARRARPYGDALAALDAPTRRAGPRAAGRALPGRPDRFRAARVRDRARPARDALAREPIAAGHARGLNPSLPGGAKAEDTYLVTGGRAGAGDQRAGLAGAEPDDELGSARHGGRQARMLEGGTDMPTARKGSGGMTGADILARRGLTAEPAAPQARPGSRTARSSGLRSPASRDRACCRAVVERGKPAASPSTASPRAAARCCRPRPS